MSTEEYTIGYEAGYQDGWNAAMEQQPAKREPLTYEELESIGKQQDPCVLLHHNVLAFARAIIAAYEAKNSIGEQT